MPNSHDRVLGFLSRRRADSIGGIQTRDRQLMSYLEREFRVEDIRWGGSLVSSILCGPGFAWQTVKRGVNVLHGDDAFTAGVAALIGRMTGRASVGTVHGKDLTLPLPPFQAMLPHLLSRLDAVVAVSSATAREALERGAPPERLHIIPNWVRDPGPGLDKEQARIALNHRLGFAPDQKLLFSLGRPLRRKGFVQFASQLFPSLPENYHYIVAGPARPQPALYRSISSLLPQEFERRLSLILELDDSCLELARLSEHPRIHYLNYVDDELRELLFRGSDLFLMPNQSVPGDMEGFGIVALEAAVRGLSVVA